MAPPASLSGQEEALYQLFKARLIDEAPALLKVLALKPEIEVTVKRQVIEADGDSLRGRLARLIKDGFFDSGPSGEAARLKLASQGFKVSPGSIYPELEALATLGFLTIGTGEGSRGRPVKSFTAAPGMKVHVK